MIRANAIRTCTLSLGLAASTLLVGAAAAQEGGAYSGLVASHAAAHGLPPSLVHRVIMRESRYNPRAVSRGNYGMMQIRLGTARAMGYTGSAAGLLDPNVNMTYAVKYLAGAYRAAGGNPNRAVALYASGYHHVAKRQGTSAVALAGGAPATTPAFGAPMAEGPMAQGLTVATPDVTSARRLRGVSREARRARGQYYVQMRRRGGAPMLGVTTSRDDYVL